MASMPGILRRLQRRSLRLLEAAFEATVRYPYDLCEMPWDDSFYGGWYWRDDRPDDPPAGPGSAGGRPIKLVPPPASRRYHAESPRQMPRNHRSKHLV